MKKKYLKTRTTSELMSLICELTGYNLYVKTSLRYMSRTCMINFIIDLTNE